MDRILGLALIVATIGGLVALSVIASRIPPEVTCGDPKLAAALSSPDVAWEEFGWPSQHVEPSPTRSAGYRYMPEGACELGFVDRPGDGPCSYCTVFLLQVMTAPTVAQTVDVVRSDSSHENHYPVEQVSERHWEETIPEKFRETGGSMFSWTASGCRFVSIRWNLHGVHYEESDLRQARALTFLDSLPGDGCTPQPPGAEAGT